MSISAGPDLVQDGLILNLDAANSTSLININTNLLPYPENFSSGWSLGPNLKYIATVAAPDGSLTAWRTRGDGSGGNEFFSRTVTYNANTTYTASCWARLAAGPTQTAAGGIMSIEYNNGAGSTRSVVSFTGLTSTWTRFTTTFTNVNAGTYSAFFLADATTVSEVDIWGCCIEQGTAATTLFSSSTNVVPSTRWNDISGNGGYGVISGSHSYIRGLYNAPVFMLNNNNSSSSGQLSLVTQNMDALAKTYNFTVMFAAKKNYYGLLGNNNGNSQLFQGAANGYSSGWRISENNQGTPGTLFTGTHNWSIGFNDINVSQSVSDTVANRMSIVALTVSSTTVTAFVNGNTASRSNPQTYISGADAPVISFTGAGAGSFNGYIGCFMIYNRALSITEIQQNFNALRGRYGI